MNTGTKRSARPIGATYDGNVAFRRLIGCVRVSTDVQASEGISLEAQRAAIEQYCALHALKLVKVYQDILSGGEERRPGLQDALKHLGSGGDVLVVVKFARLSRSIRHFCELYETYFKDGAKELVAIRESIRLDSALGRALDQEPHLQPALGAQRHSAAPEQRTAPHRRKFEGAHGRSAQARAHAGTDRGEPERTARAHFKSTWI